jgi:hypothetical protein
MLLALRLNVLAKGYSGIRAETVKRMIQAFNAGCLSLVPEKVLLLLPMPLPDFYKYLYHPCSRLTAPRVQ